MIFINKQAFSLYFPFHLSYFHHFAINFHHFIGIQKLELIFLPITTFFVLVIAIIHFKNHQHQNIN